MLSDEMQEIAEAVERLKKALDDVAVRGLRALGGEQFKSLVAMHDELARVGAGHLAGCLDDVIRAVREDDRDGPAALLRAQATLRLFDRVMTLEVAEKAYQVLLAADELDEDEEEDEA